MATNNRENSNFYEIAITDAGGGNVFDIDVPGNVTAGGVSTFSNIGNIRISGGGNGQVLTTDGASNLSWTTPIANTNAAGSNTQIQFNNGGLMAASNRFTYSNGLITTANANITGNLLVTGNSNVGPVGNLKITGGTNGQILSTDGAGNLSWITSSGAGGSGQSMEVREGSVSGWITAFQNNLTFQGLKSGYTAIPGLSYISGSGNWTNTSGSTLYLLVSFTLEISTASGAMCYITVYENLGEVYRSSGTASTAGSTAIRLTAGGILRVPNGGIFGARGWQQSGTNLGVFTYCSIALLPS